ncbi:MAG: DNA-3-methyladenine glycosylase [Acidobacteriota bacterium]
MVPNRAGSTAVPLPGELLPRGFFEAPPEKVAPLVLGKLLVRSLEDGSVAAGRIVEVEAYLGPHNHPPDPAAHAYRGPTPRNRVLFGPAGHAYVYSIYGMHFCMNISCEREGLAGCVLVRALEPVTGLATMMLNRNLDGEAPLRMLAGGPSRLCQALGITRPAHNGVDLLDPRSELQIRDDGFAVAQYRVTPRIGITRAADRPLRFVAAGYGESRVRGRKLG